MENNIQAVLFPLSWTSDKCKEWLNKHNLKPLKRVHLTHKYLRYRIREPSEFKKFITKGTKEGVKLVIGYK